MGTALELLKKAGLKFMDDKAPRLGAALAFYTALSLSPLLLMVVGLAGLVFGDEAARGELAGQIQNLVGAEGAQVIQGMLAKPETQSRSWTASLIGVATLIFGASGVFAQMQDALNTVWNVKPAETSGWGIWALVRDRLLSFSAVCGMAFLLLVSLVFSTVVSAMSTYANGWLPNATAWMQVLNLLISFALTTIMFAIIFKVLPGARPAWGDVWIGAALTSVLFTLGKFLIGLYLGQAAVGSAYGAAGSFVVLLVWIYYSTQILLYGAEFTQVYATTHGSGWKATLPDATHATTESATAAQPTIC